MFWNWTRGIEVPCVQVLVFCLELWDPKSFHCSRNLSYILSLTHYGFRSIATLVSKRISHSQFCLKTRSWGPKNLGANNKKFVHLLYGPELLIKYYLFGTNEFMCKVIKAKVGINVSTSHMISFFLSWYHSFFLIFVSFFKLNFKNQYHSSSHFCFLSQTKP